MMRGPRRSRASAPRTVLFVQRYPDGGSITGLFDLVRSLDPARYRAVVSFRVPNAFVEEFRRDGIECVVMEGESTLPAAPSTVPDGPPVAPTAPRSSSELRRELRRLIKRDVPAARHVARLVRRFDADIVHANSDVHSDRDAVLAAWATRLPCVSSVRWIHEYEPGPTRWIDRFLAHRTARFVHMSRAIREGHAPLGVDPSRELVLDDPFDLDEYGGPAPAGLRSELGIGEGSRVVVNVGRIIPWKGQDVFLRAMADVVHERPDVVALLVGEATDQAGAQFQRELEALVEELGIEDHVVFAGRRRDIPDILAASAVFVHSATMPEPFGRVVVEAMAAARPLVAVGAGGVPEFVADGETGRLVPLGEVAPMVAAIGELLDDPQAAESMGKAARAVAEARFDRARFGEVVQAMYDDLVAAGRWTH